MTYSSICFSEQFTFLKYVNAHYLFYGITLATFASLFFLVWILKTYTYFEKQKITRGSLPAFPYGNFGDTIRGNTSLHTFLWKHHNRFKRKRCSYGGLFLLVRPVLVAVNSGTLSSTGHSIFPRESKLKQEDVVGLLSSSELFNTFIQSFSCSVKDAIPEKLLTSDAATVLKDYLLESTCQLFGFQASQMVPEINEWLNRKFNTTLMFYLRLCCPLLGKLQKPPKHQPQELLLELMEFRKKNDTDANDLIEAFTRLLNESDYAIEDVAEDVVNSFLDTLTYSCSSLMFCLYELANSSETQQELVGEIRRFNKDHKALTHETIGQLEYLNAVIKETFRKYPPVATIINSSKDLDWNPDKNGLIFQSVLGIHRDAQFYTKPEAFEPDRFMDNIPVNDNNYMPFGPGPASHLCMKLVSLQVALVLMSIFSHLEVKLKDGSAAFKYNRSLLYLAPSEGPHLEFART